jgi:hypothetical protein
MSIIWRQEKALVEVKKGTVTCQYRQNMSVFVAAYPEPDLKTANSAYGTQLYNNFRTVDQ